MRCFVRCVVFTIFAVFVLAGTAHTERPEHFNYPIRLLNVETGYLLGRGGDVQIGLGQSGVGVLGRLQVTTDLMLDVATFFNGQVKLGILPEAAPFPSLSAGFAYYNLISAGYITDAAVEATFTDEETETTSGLEVYYFFFSLSRTVHPRLRVHASYQYHYLEGLIDSREPYELVAGEDTATVYMTVDQRAVHRSVMTGVDFDLLENLKLLFEFGYDVSMDRVRGGGGVRVGAGSFNLQLGALWPGIRLEEDINMPVVPNVGIFFRF